jgi:hypothetical protein
VWQYWPEWQYSKCRDDAPWHSQVFTVTLPSAQWAKRLNLIAAEAFWTGKHAIIQRRAAIAPRMIFPSLIELSQLGTGSTS